MRWLGPVCGCEDLPILQVRDRAFNSGADQAKLLAVRLIVVIEFPTGPGRGGRREFHPPAPTDPGVTLSRHRALLNLFATR